jgi:hypothetical protein
MVNDKSGALRGTDELTRSYDREAGHTPSIATERSLCMRLERDRGSLRKRQSVLGKALYVPADRVYRHGAGLFEGIPFGDEPGQYRAGHDIPSFLRRLKE